MRLEAQQGGSLPRLGNGWWALAGA